MLIIVAQGHTNLHVREAQSHHNTFRSAVKALSQLSVHSPAAGIIIDATNPRQIIQLDVSRAVSGRWMLTLTAPGIDRRQFSGPTREHALFNALSTLGIAKPAVPALLYPLALQWNLRLPEGYRQAVRKDRHMANQRVVQQELAATLMAEFTTYSEAQAS